MYLSCLQGVPTQLVATFEKPHSWISIEEEN